MTVLLGFFNLLTLSYLLPKKDDMKPKIPQASDLDNTGARSIKCFDMYIKMDCMYIQGIVNLYCTSV